MLTQIVWNSQKHFFSNVEKDYYKTTTLLPSCNSAYTTNTLLPSCNSAHAITWNNLYVDKQATLTSSNACGLESSSDSYWMQTCSAAFFQNPTKRIANLPNFFICLTGTCNYLYQTHIYLQVNRLALFLVHFTFFKAICKWY